MVQPGMEAEQCWCVIPVKELDRAKSRLSPVIPDNQRRELAFTMFTRVVAAVSACRLLVGWIVVTRDDDVAAMTRLRGGVALYDRADALNGAVAEGCQEARLRGATSVLVVPSDLPLVTAGEIERIIKLGEGLRRGIVVVPSRKRDGTNALYLKPPNVIEPCFGPGSFARHIQAAWTSGSRVMCCESFSVGIDIDTPDDISFMGCSRDLAGWGEVHVC